MNMRMPITRKNWFAVRRNCSKSDLGTNVRTLYLDVVMELSQYVPSGSSPPTTTLRWRQSCGGGTAGSSRFPRDALARRRGGAAAGLPRGCYASGPFTAPASAFIDCLMASDRPRFVSRPSPVIERRVEDRSEDF